MHFALLQDHNVIFPRQPFLPSGVLLPADADDQWSVASPGFVPQHRPQIYFINMITPAAAPGIVQSGRGLPRGCRTNHPQDQYRSKTIYILRPVPCTTNAHNQITISSSLLTASANAKTPSCCLWWQREGCKRSVSVRRQTGTSWKAGGGRGGTHRPNSQSTRIQKIHTLSGGQGQRCGLAFSLSCYCDSVWLIGRAAASSGTTRRPMKQSNDPTLNCQVFQK